MKLPFNPRGKTTAHTSCARGGAPSPWGEGRGEGNGDPRQPAAFSRAVLGPQPNAGVALVITLILLAVITFMTVTFLVVTHSETSNVKTQYDQTTARLAAEQALEQAKELIMIPMMTFTNP